MSSLATTQRRQGAEATRSSTRLKKKKFKFFSVRGGIDIPFLIALLSLVVVGLVMMFSASYPSAYYYTGSSYTHLIPQAANAVLGLVIMFVVSYVDYHKLHIFAYPIYAVAVLLLGLVLILPAGDGGVHRWITIGVTFQPSEIAKFALILVLSHYASVNFNKMEDFTTGIAKPAAFCLIICILLILEPHYSCTVIILLLFALMIFLSGAKARYFIIMIIGIVLALVIAYFAGLLSYVTERFEGWGTALTYINDKQWNDDTWQTRNSLYAIGSGGLTGLGPGQSRQKYLFLPEPQNDFIFAVVCEELGFIGASLILCLFGYLVWRGIRVSLRATDNFGKLLGIGLTAQIGIQVILNILVITDWLPNTGISLPFFSYGGTSLVMLLAQMGVVMSISRTARIEKT